MKIARPVSKVAVAPRHEHDCDKCRFLGAATTTTHSAYDLYYCPSRGGGYVVRRSSEPSDYGSFGLDMSLAPAPGTLYALCAALWARGDRTPRHYRIDD